MESNPLKAQGQEDPGAQAPAPMVNIARSSAANDLMFEDCLKSILLKAKTGKIYCSYKTKFCPRPMQSPFGDFPPEYLPEHTKTKAYATASPNMFSKSF